MIINKPKEKSMSHDVSAAKTDANAAFAAYFNVARHNLLLALNSVSERTGLKPIENDSDLLGHPVLSKLKDWAQLEENGGSIPDKDIRAVQRVLKGVQKALPILNDDFAQAVSGQRISQEYKREASDRHSKLKEEPKKNNSVEKTIRTWRVSDLAWALSLLTETLMKLRNYHSHAYQNSVNPEKSLIQLLGIWFDASRREIKSRFDFSEHEVAHLVRYDPKTKREDPKRPHALYSAKQKKYSFTESGRAFFCCLFLEKQQVYELLGQLSGFKNKESSRPHQATLRTYGHWSIRLPFQRIDTSSTSQSLALDIMNELARCPIEIYENLSAQYQKIFEVTSEVEDKSQSHEIGFSDEEFLQTRFIRHSDRFAPLILQYLDHIACADRRKDIRIRFQLDLGDFYFAAYPKRLTDGSIDNRRLKQKILRFGLLSEAIAQSQNKPDVWKRLECVNLESEPEHPYIVQTRAHYHFPKEGGSIAIQLIPKLSPNLYDEPIENPEKKGQFKPLASQRPDFWLSPYELVNLIFYQLLRTTHVESLHDGNFPGVDDVLKAYRASLKRLYKAIMAKPESWVSASKAELGDKLNDFCHTNGHKPFYTLRPKDLPGDLQDLLLGKVKVPKVQMQQQAAVTIDLLKKEGDARLRDLFRAQNSLNERIKVGKSAHRVLRAGEMATFLAKDMLRLQPLQDVTTAHKGKPTSILADLLQARLAYFGRDKNSLPALLKSLKLTGNKDPNKNHPFVELINVNDPRMNGIAQYYKQYLLERQAYLSKLQEQLANGDFDLESPALAWLNLAEIPQRLKGRDQLSSLLSRYLTSIDDTNEVYEPLNLPRGLFRELILGALSRLNHPGLNTGIKKAMDLENDRQIPTSVSYLIDLYFRSIRDDGYQEYYCFEKSKLSKRLTEAAAELDFESDWAQSTMETLRRERTKSNVKELKALVAAAWEDRRRKLNSYTTDLEKNMRLRAAQDQVLYLAARHLMDLSEEGKQNSNANASENSSVNMFDNIKLKTLSREDLNLQVSHRIEAFEKTIYTDQIKAKNIHKFKRLARDRRMKGLLHYYDATHIHVNIIEYELQAYPRAQLHAFKFVLGFEKKYNEDQKLQATGLSHGESLHRKIVEQSLKTSAKPVDELSQLCDQVLTLRNAFCHNQLPHPLPKSDPAAIQMLKGARLSLAYARQQNTDLKQIIDRGSVADFFAEELKKQYSSLGTN